MTTTLIGKTKELVEKKTQAYFDMYPVQSYGTEIQAEGFRDGFFFVTIYRY